MTEAADWIAELAGEERPERRPVSEPAPRARRASGGTRERRYGEAVVDRECQKLRETAPGGRNHQLNKSAFSIGQFIASAGLDESAAIAELKSAAKACGLTDDDGEHATEKTIESGLGDGKKDPKPIPPPEERKAKGSTGKRAEPPPGRFDDEEPDPAPPEDAPPESTRQPHTPPTEEEWPEPIPFDDVGLLPEFPVDALPRRIREWVLAEAESTQTPVELSASMALAVVSAIVSKRFEVEVRPGWREPLCTFWIAALPPGERKSAVFRDATRAIREWQAERVKESTPKIHAAAARKLVKEKAYKTALEKAARSGLPADVQLAEQLAVELGEFRIPVAPRITADDATPEKLAHLISQYGGRLAIMSAEGGVFETCAGRYADGVVNIDVLLKGHAGDELQVDRINRAPLHVRRPALTLGLCVQPDVLEGLATKRSFRGRGLLARCLFLLPTSKVGRREVAPAPVDGLVDEAFDDLCRRLLDLPEQRDENDEITPAVLRLTPAAVRILDTFAQELEPRLAPGGDLEPVRDWAAKLVGACVRIAGLLHLAGASESFEACEGGDTSEGFESDLQRATKIGSFLLSHSVAAFRAMGADPVLGKARILLSSLTTLTSLRSPHCTKRQLHQANRSTFSRSADLDEPLALLDEHGFIRLVPQPATGGRPKSPLYEVNPAVHRKGGAE